MKPKYAARESALVMAATSRPTMHTAHGSRRLAPNPYTSWCWYGPGGDMHEGFKRLADAKADVERVHGKVDWKEENRCWRGYFGPTYTPDEWLDRSGAKRIEPC